jgi:hypothetical protein
MRMWMNSNNEEVPGWASFFTKEEYHAFLEALGSYFQSKGLTPVLEGSSVKVEGGSFGAHQLGLTNVAQVCKQQEPEDYGEAIASHFEAMERGEVFRQEFEKIAGDYEKVKPYIGVRLYPQHYMDNLPKNMFIGKAFADDMYAMLIFDMPDTITNIKPGHAEKWDTTFEDLFETGVRNTKANNPLEISDCDFGEFSIRFAQADHFFVPNIVFELENRPDLTGKYGALVGVPHRHAALIYPINGMEIIQAINGLIPAIHGMHREGPGSLSPSLLWYHQGNFINLPYELDDQNMRFTPPASFVELLNDLAEKE